MPTDEDLRHYDDLGTGVEWGTPPRIVEPLADALDGFDLDAASGAEPRPYAETRFDVDDDGLAQPWRDDVWLNPPYGRKHNPLWAKKVSKEAARDDVDTITCLIPASTATNWFEDHYANADYLTLIHERLSFVGGDDDATFASAIASFGDFPSEYVAALERFGTVWSKKE